MGKRLNKIKAILLNNWDRNAKKIVVALGVFLIAICTESIIPVSGFLKDGSQTGDFLVAVYKYAMALVTFIIGAVFGKQENGNGK